MRGSILVTFDEAINDRGIDRFSVFVNNVQRDFHYTDINNYYSTFCFLGDVVEFNLVFSVGTQAQVSVIRRDFTTDDEGGDRGIKETPVTNTTSTVYNFIFTATTRPDAYNFHYIIDAQTIPCFESGTGFTGASGVGQFISDIEFQSNNLIFGGSYSNYDGISRFSLIKTDLYGQIDLSFGLIPIQVAVYDIAVQNDEKIIIISNTDIIYRLNSNGTLDNTFISGRTSNTIQEGEEICDIQNDGKILFGARFTGYTGSTVWNQTGLVRLNTNGSVDTTWNSGGTGITFDNVQGAIREINIQDDEKIMLGGRSFRFYNGTEVNGLTRLNINGSLDNTFTNYSYPSFPNQSPSVNVITKLQSNKYIIGCDNDGTYSGNNVGYLFGINSDGTFNSSFPFNQISIFVSDSVQDIIELSNGKILIGGQFTTYSGQSVNNLIMINQNGTLDTSFNTGTGFGGSAILVRTLLELPNNRILVGGDFQTYNGVTVNKIIRLDFNGNLENC
jgi:uncharacterized delta-60 repeat protein